MRIRVHQLPSGYWHVRGDGPEEWAQPPTWPCDEATLRSHAALEASGRFIRAALAAARSEERRWRCDDCGAVAFFGMAAPEVCPFCAPEDADAGRVR